MEATLINTNIILLDGYKIEKSLNVKSQPVARFYRMLNAGKFKGTYKMIQGFYFQNEERREKYINDKIAAINKAKAEKKEKANAKKALRDNMEHPFQVGQIYYDSWGYEQTNIDFYIVVEAKEKSLILQQIGKTNVSIEGNGMSAQVKPDTFNLMGKPHRKNILFYMTQDNKPEFYIKSEHGWINRYDNGENGVYCSWYA